MIDEPAFKAHIRHENDARDDYERYMLREHGEPVRQVTALSCGLFRLLAADTDATTEPR